MYLLTYLLTPWCRVLLEKLTGLQPVKKFPAFHGTRRFITALTSVRQLSLSWANPISVHIPTSHLLEIHPNIIHQSTPMCPQWSPSLRFPHQDPIHHHSSPIRATCPTHLILLDFITRTILSEEYKSFSSSLCNLLHSHVTSSLLGPNILLNTMLSSTHSFLSSRNVNDQISQTYKPTGKIRVECLLYCLECVEPFYNWPRKERDIKKQQKEKKEDIMGKVRNNFEGRRKGAWRS